MSSKSSASLPDWEKSEVGSTSTVTDNDSTTIPSRMPSYSNTDVLLDEIQLSTDVGETTSVCNLQALRAEFDELRSELSEYSTSSDVSVSETRSEYFFEELNASQTTPHAVRSEYVLDFDGDNLRGSHLSSRNAQNPSDHSTQSVAPLLTSGAAANSSTRMKASEGTRESEASRHCTPANIVSDGPVQSLSAALKNVSLDEDNGSVDEEIAWNQERKKTDKHKPFLPSRPTGFWLFANSLFGESVTKKKDYQGSNRVFLNATFGKLRTKMIDCAQPLWNKMTDEEKKVWHKRAQNVKLVTNHKNGKGKKSGKAMAIADEDEDDDIYDEDCDAGEFDMSSVKVESEDVVPVAKSIEGKYEVDFEKITRWLLSLGQKDLTDVKRSRFLFASVQTYGDLDRNVIPAEIAIVEFSLRHGILDLYSAIVGPWEIANDVLRFRANFNCKETHKIPIDLKTMLKIGVKFTNKTDVVGELLGRVEPYMARRQGFQVGLYREGVLEFDDEFEIRSSTLQNGKINTSAVVQHLSEHKPILPGPDDEHRWIVCLDHECDIIMRALDHLKTDLSFAYKDFPTTPDRFITVSAFIDAFKRHVQSDSEAIDYNKTFGGLGSPKTAENSSSWDNANDRLFCAFHRKTRNACCASFTACRACVCIFTELKNSYELDLI